MKVWIISSSRVQDEKYLNLSKQVATFFVKRGDELLCGGINNSMMKKIFDIFAEGQRPTTCVTLECYQENLERVTNKILVDSTFDRTKTLYQMADILLFLPGGSGSLAEIFASLEEHRTIFSQKKLILYNYDGFYDATISILKKLIELNFNDNNIKEHIIVVNTMEELEKKVSEEDE